MSTPAYMNAPGAQLAWRTMGSGPPVLLIHAGVADQRMWDPVATRLVGAHRILTFDMRGFGMTRTQAGGFSPADDVMCVLQAAGVSRVHVVGASYGGEVALAFAAENPERIASLTLLAPSLPDAHWSERIETFAAAEEAALAAGDVDQAVELNLAMWIDRPGLSPHRAQALRDLVGPMQRQAFVLQVDTEVEAKSREPDLAVLSGMSAPITVLVGEADVEDFARIAADLRRALPEAKFDHVPNAGHLTALEAPDYVAHAIATTIAAAPF